MRPLLSDRRVEAGIQAIRETFGQADSALPPRAAVTEVEIQVAHDAYFERMNHAWLE
jgi:hypothetical protein